MDKITKKFLIWDKKENISIKISQEINEVNVCDPKINPYHAINYNYINVPYSYYIPFRVNSKISRTVTSILEATPIDLDFADRLELINSDPMCYEYSSFKTHRRKYYSREVIINEGNFSYE